MSHNPFRYRRSSPTIATAVGVAALLAMSGCSGSSGGSDGGNVTLSMSTLAVAGGSGYTKMAAEYSKAHPGITIKVTEVPNEQYGELLRTQLQAGNGPDMFYTTGGTGSAQSIIPLAKAGYLLPLGDTSARSLLEGTNLQLASYDGKIYGSPFDEVPIGNIYSAVKAESLGISLPFDSIDDMKKACKTAKDAGTSLWFLAGSTVQNNGMLAMQLAASRVYGSDPDWNDQRAAGKVTFADTKGWTEVFQAALDLRDAGCFQKGYEGTAIADVAPALEAGKAVGDVYGPLGAINAAAPNTDFVMSVMPADNGAKARTYLSANNLLALNASMSPEQQKAAKGFVDWLAEPDNANKTAELQGTLSALTGTSKKSSADVPKAYRLIKDYLSDPSKTQALPSLSWPGPGVYSAIGPGMQGLFTGQVTIPQLLNTLDQQWNAAS